MIRFCEDCQRRYDDACRWTICPHGTFAANDGQNNFAHHPEAYLSEAYLSGNAERNEAESHAGGKAC